MTAPRTVPRPPPDYVRALAREAGLSPRPVLSGCPSCGHRTAFREARRPPPGPGSPGVWEPVPPKVVWRERCLLPACGFAGEWRT